MRITSLWELKKYDDIRSAVMENLMDDIISVAEAKYKYKDLTKFKIEFRLVRVGEYE